MAISFVSVGGNSRSGNGNVTPGLPPGWTINDIFICTIASKDNVNSSMPPGWTIIDQSNNGTGLRTTTFYKIAVAGDTNPTVIHIGGSNIEATILAYRDVDTLNPLDVIGTTSINASSTTVRATSITTLTDTAWVIFTGSIASRSTFSTYSGSPIPTERLDTPNTANYPSTFLADFAMSTAGSTGNRTCNATTAAVNNGLMFALRPATATLMFITDPSGANIYINGILQPVNTSTSIAILSGNYTIIFYKAGYYSYTETVTGLGANQIVKVSTILIQAVSIIDQGIVFCTGLSYITCPASITAPCPISITPLDYINFLTILDNISGSPITLTVRFLYSLDDIIYNIDVPVVLPLGTSIVYAFTTNQRYGSNTIISLDNVILI